MGKLERTIHGHMVDLVLDIRKGSPSFGKVFAYDIRSHPKGHFDDWIWIPPGFALGIAFLEDTLIEYLCTGEYNPGCEAGLSPVAKDLDWTLCDPQLRDQVQQIASDTP